METYTWVLLTEDGTPITGGAADTTLNIMRVADKMFLDFDDGVFKSSGWVAISDPFLETDATNYPGNYYIEVDISGWDDGEYKLRALYTGSPQRQGAEVVRILNAKDSIQSIYDLSLDVHDESFGKWVIDPSGKTLTLYRADGVTVLKVFNLTEASGRVPAYVARAPA